MAGGVVTEWRVGYGRGSYIVESGVWRGSYRVEGGVLKG